MTEPRLTMKMLHEQQAQMHEQQAQMRLDIAALTEAQAKGPAKSAGGSDYVLWQGVVPPPAPGEGAALRGAAAPQVAPLPPREPAVQQVAWADLAPAAAASAKTKQSRYLLDLAERVGTTYLEVYLGLWLASGLGFAYVTDLSSADKALTATLPAILALVKGLAARGVGSPDTAALLDEAADTPEPT